MQRLTPELLGLALTRRSAPEWVRARVPAESEWRRERLRALSGLASERMVLHTCERFEVYAVVETDEEVDWERRLAGWLGLEPDAIHSFVECRRGDDVAVHLLRVAAGLESRLVGEPQIQGQVRGAFREATEEGARGPVLGALARAALHAGRRVRGETPLGGRRASIVDLTVWRLRAELGSLRGRSVLLAGTGALATEILAALAARGAQVVVMSRTRERAASLAARFGAAALGLRDLRPALARADALVSCTHRVLPIRRADLRGRGLAIVDLGAPPNLCRGLGSLPGVRLVRLGDVAPASLEGDVSAAERIVAEEAERFRRWRLERPAAPLLAELIRTQADEGRRSREERRALHLQIERLKATLAA